MEITVFAVFSLLLSLGGYFMLVKKKHLVKEKHFVKEKHIDQPVKPVKKEDSRNWELIDYNRYHMRVGEHIKYIILSFIFLFFISFLFFRNIPLCIGIVPLSFFYPAFKRKELVLKRKQQLQLQFKDALYSLSSSLSAGRTIESAFKWALEDLQLLYPDPSTYIIKEIEVLNRKIEMNETIESALSDFSARAGVEDIQNFTDVFTLSKRTGANLVEVIKNTTVIINDKIEIMQDIETLLSQRKFEQRILNIMPIGLILFLYLTSPDYLLPIYTTMQGRITMFFVLIMLSVSYYMSKKIIEISV